jgi:superfamily II DNA or RNA helicase
MKLVVSPHLSQEDVESLEGASADPQRVLQSIAAGSLEELEDAILKDRLNALAWLAAAGLLEVKLALRLDGHGKFTRGIFHEKAGIFTDEAENHVAFSGSANETAGGLLENFESLKVFRSWVDPEGRVAEELANFEALWNNSTPGLKVISFTDATRELLESFRDPGKPLPGLATRVTELKSGAASFRSPPGLIIRDYQIDAIRSWSKAGGQGIFAMATGSGKTITALTLAVKVSEKNSPLAIVVVCPYLNLCRQWEREFRKFGLNPTGCHEGLAHWEEALEHGYQRLQVGLDKVIALVVSNATFLSAPFQNRFRPRTDMPSIHHLLIADEVHNLGSPRIQAALPQGIKMRLGLSATPERHMDPVGTKVVFDYFGGVVAEYPIGKAIAEGRLCQYRYHPVVVRLTPDEAETYLTITRQLIPFMSDDGGELAEGALRLLMRRARLLGSAAGKLDALDEVLNGLPQKPKKSIFYCGDGRTNDKIHDEEVRQIQAVAHLISSKHDLRVRNFTFRETSQEREEILRDFDSGFLDGIVAIRCLDEGIDLPDLQYGFLLASSTNPRQHIQRRGRLLRPAPGKEMAEIYDFIIEPPDLGEDDAAYNLERRLFRRELKRITEFCGDAFNGPDVLQNHPQLRALRLKYGLLAE